MKKYSICFLLFVITSMICLFIGFFMTRNQIRRGEALPEATMETMEVLPEGRAAANQEEVEPVTLPAETTVDSRYCLVSEDGFLLVFCEEPADVCLYTHMPITDFPEPERDRLRVGIWFDTMIEVFHYLESYTS